jgi:sigma-B regulation protein RsbU (phosphoserine phosphatase)
MRSSTISSIHEQLLKKDFKLHSLLEITNAINSNQSVERICMLFEFILREQLGISKFILYNKQTQWNTLLKIGFKGKIKDLDVEADLFRFREITVIESSPIKALHQFDVIVPILHKKQALAYLLIAGLEEQRLDENETMEFIQTLANIIVVAIENKRLAALSIKQEKMKKELELAAELQKLLFPAELPSNQDMDISAKYKSHHEVGGDYYDFIYLGDNEYAICIADVSGKGIGAAMLMANFQATIRTLFNYQRFDLDFLISELNNRVMDNSKGEKFITFFVAIYNSETRKINYVNAGHNHPILTNGKTAEFLDDGCIGLGMLQDIPTLSIGERILAPNTTLCMYTDGLVELNNEKDEQFETDRLVKLIHNYYPIKMEDMNNLIFSKLDEWRGEREFEDDTAILSCRFF